MVIKGLSTMWMVPRHVMTMMSDVRWPDARNEDSWGKGLLESVLRGDSRERMATSIRRRATVSLPTFAGSYGDTIVQSFDTYEEYLDSQITSTDLFYLEDIDLARQLVELGYRSNAEIMTRDQFTKQKEALEQSRLQALQKVPKKIFSAGKDLSGFPFLKALADREHAVRHGNMATIIFIRDYNPKGHEISGYIDYGERLKSEDLEPIFDCKKRLLPMPYDLSYYNWVTLNSCSNSSSNYQVVADSVDGLLLKNKKDRKILSVDPNKEPGDNSTRTTIETDEYQQVVIYDHSTRRRV
ncbi:hypothetical protein GOP47_0021825 [Adiantum capillus-veneris]|uniref:Cilia- and flagella-associated protein 299 n=1 Tax=Adiantum capillus-veneris TaxID=13818 RepID=A0A9D4Z5L2_ADICA|nr:hypothetical protein GOP47_0021825 [Adiantum capillus-veneris]